MNAGDNGFRKSTALFILLGVFLLPCSINGKSDNCTVRKIVAERLPDLNVPRSAHSAFCVDGEVTVVGGHTTNFVPTATAEYFKDGEWHLVETAFPHDNGICAVHSSGKVLLGGGSEKPLGSDVLDRLKGEPLHVPLLRRWQPRSEGQGRHG